MTRDAPLKVSIEGEELVIRIGINTLARAFDHCDENIPWDDGRNEYVQISKVVDVEEFAKDVVGSMTVESETGQTPLTNFIDKSCVDAANDGSIGVDDCGVVFKG